MNTVLIRSPANITGEDLRQLLLSALGGDYDKDTDTWSDNNPNVVIPAVGIAPGTHAQGGVQVTQLITGWTETEIETMLADAKLNQHKIRGMQTFETFLIPDSDPPVYAPTVIVPVHKSIMANLNKRYEADEVTEIPSEYNWFPVYAGSSVWVGE